MKAIYWHDESMGADYSIEEIPADLQAEAEEWRDKMLEALAECDDAIMEKYFDDPSTITEEEIHTAIVRNISYADQPDDLRIFIQEQRCSDVIGCSLCLFAVS